MDQLDDIKDIKDFRQRDQIIFADNTNSDFKKEYLNNFNKPFNYLGIAEGFICLRPVGAINDDNNFYPLVDKYSFGWKKYEPYKKNN